MATLQSDLAQEHQVKRDKLTQHDKRHQHMTMEHTTYVNTLQRYINTHTTQ